MTEPTPYTSQGKDPVPNGWSVETVWEQIPGQVYSFRDKDTYPTLEAAQARARPLKSHVGLIGFNIYDSDNRLWGGWKRNCM